MHKYEIIIYWSDEDDAFVAEVHELSGCMAHSNTPEKALRNAKQLFNCGSTQPGSLATRFWNPKENALSLHEVS